MQNMSYDFSRARRDFFSSSVDKAFPSTRSFFVGQVNQNNGDYAPARAATINMNYWQSS